MNQAEFTKLVEATIEVTGKLLIIKGEEYAGSEDRLANFKRGADRIGITPLQVALIYASKHFDALCTYVQKDSTGAKQSLSEPIEGRLDDLINYCFLMKALIVENERLPKKAEPFSVPVYQNKIPCVSCFDTKWVRTLHGEMELCANCSTVNPFTAPAHDRRAGRRT